MDRGSPIDRRTALAENLTVGLPFCVFKLTFGLFLVGQPGPITTIAGGALIALGVADTVLNGINLVSLASRRRRSVPICTATFLVARTRHHARADGLGTAIDMLLSFTLVAAAVGGGLLPEFDAAALTIWNVAVVVNVLGAGLLRVGAALKET